MKRIISLFTILSTLVMLISGTGYAGIHVCDIYDRPAVFGALRDEASPDISASGEDGELFLLSDTQNDTDNTDPDNKEENTSDPKDTETDNSTDNNGNEDSENTEDTNADDSTGDPGTSGETGETDGPEDETGENAEGDQEEETEPPFTAEVPISDDYFSLTQYSFYNIGKYLQYGNERFTEQTSRPGIDLDVAHGWRDYEADISEKQPVIVAVIDTGVDYLHPDLADSMWVNPGEIPDNDRDDDGNGYIDDVYGWDFYNNDNTVCHYITDESTGLVTSDPSDCDDHGTHVAGLIAAVKDNGIGIAGLASVGNVRIMSLKIHGGTNRKGKLSDAIKAIRYAERMGASVCNISWGTYTYSASLASAIKNSKMLFVCAAGNDGTDNDSRPIYPACFGFDNVISVGFVNANGKLPFNSNYGRNTVDTLVPATDIMSTTVGGYSSISGSSMAAPQISAMAALLYSYGSQTWAGAVRDAILGSIRELDEFEKLIKYPGIPSLSAAVHNASQLPQDSTAPDFSLNVSYDVNGIKITFSPTDKGGSGISAIRYLTGSRTYEDFRNGTEGLTVDNNVLYLAKPGVYTFLVEDRAGNYAIKTIPIMDDIVLPRISDAFLYTGAADSGLSVSAHVADFHSGIRTVKYMRGRHTASDFKSSGSGTLLVPDDEGNISFEVTEQGPYTIYAVDNRGNTTTVTVMAYIRPVLAAGPGTGIQSLTFGMIRSRFPDV